MADATLSDAIILGLRAECGAGEADPDRGAESGIDGGRDPFGYNHPSAKSGAFV